MIAVGEWNSCIGRNTNWGGDTRNDGKTNTRFLECLRFFATAAAWSLGLAVYDTQCGAKLFRSSDGTRALFTDPFITKWTFDVEVIARRIRAGRESELPDIRSVLYELPLDQWSGISGSKVRPLDLPRALIGLWRIRRLYLRPTAK